MPLSPALKATPYGSWRNTELCRIPEYLPLSRGFPGGRTVIDGEIIHIHDIAAEIETEYPEAKVVQKVSGSRSVLNMPLLKEGVAIGGIGVRRTEVRPFTEKQIALLKTFADQAVIAIENVRLFKEIQERNAELREALEHQTATAEVLGIISRSPTDVQPVLDAIVESAARVCGVDDVVLRLREGDVMVPRAHFGIMAVTRPKPALMSRSFAGCVSMARFTFQTSSSRTISQPLGPSAGLAPILLVPLRQQGELIGNLAARRTEVRPFTPAQIKLLETFADQAVIAIENVRLFKELQERNRDLTEALEQQTATSEILRVIASSPTDIQPVLDVIAETQGAFAGHLMSQLFESKMMPTGSLRFMARRPTGRPAKIAPLDRGSVIGRSIVDRETIHLHDVRAVQDDFLAREDQCGTTGFADHACHTVAARRRRNWCDWYPPHGSSSLH